MATNEAGNPIAVIVGDAGAGLDAIDLLARLQLTAKRAGWSFRIYEVNDELRDLLDFVGLGDVLVVESVRQAEERIQLGVQEVVQPDDLTP